MGDQEENDDVLPGDAGDSSVAGDLGDLTSSLRATIDVAGDDAAPTQQAPAADQQQQETYQDNAPSGREGQAVAGGGFMPPPAPSANMGVREILSSFGLPAEHYPDDRAALQDLLTQTYQSHQAAQEASRRLEVLQQWAQQTQAAQEQQRAQAAQQQQQAPAGPKWKPDYADIQAVTSENGETRYVRKSTGLAVSPDLVQEAIQYNQSRDEFLRTLYERPQEAMQPIVSEAVQQAMQQFQHYQRVEQQKSAYQQSLSQANDYVVNTFGPMLFQQGPYGLNVNQPTPLGYRYLNILESMPRQLDPMEKARFASNQLAMEIMSSRPDLFAASQQNGQYQFIPNGAPPQQAPQQLSPGDQQRQNLRRVAHRNPSTASPSANGAAEVYFEDPNVDIKDKLFRAMVAN